LSDLAIVEATPPAPDMLDDLSFGSTVIDRMRTRAPLSARQGRQPTERDVGDVAAGTHLADHPDDGLQMVFEASPST